MGLNLLHLTRKDRRGYGTVALPYQKASFMEGVLHSVVIYRLSVGAILYQHRLTVGFSTLAIQNATSSPLAYP